MFQRLVVVCSVETSKKKYYINCNFNQILIKKSLSLISATKFQSIRTTLRFFNNIPGSYWCKIRRENCYSCRFVLHRSAFPHISMHNIKTSYMDLFSFFCRTFYVSFIEKFMEDSVQSLGRRMKYGSQFVSLQHLLNMKENVFIPVFEK